MEKRYQVFISSTFQDLQEERQEVMQALLELDCIPAGMELFPAANDDQWTLIKRVIDDCDYYIVISAGRYGSVHASGISYTEMEYRYALDRKKPVLGFIHKDPETLPAKRYETDSDKRERLAAFRSLILQKTCRFWQSPADLGSQVSRSLIKLIRAEPAVGWIRANEIPAPVNLGELVTLRGRVQELQGELENLKSATPAASAELATGDDLFRIHFGATTTDDNMQVQRIEGNVSLSWNEIFAALAPLMIDEAREFQLLARFSALLAEHGEAVLKKQRRWRGATFRNFAALEDEFNTVKVQLRALGLMVHSTKPRSLRDNQTYWSLTRYGDSVMTHLRAIRKISN